MRSGWTLLIVGLGLVVAANPAYADDEPTPAPPPAAEEIVEEDLPVIDIVAPRPRTDDDEAFNESALRRNVPEFDIPNTGVVVDQDDLRLRRSSRSISDALQGTGGVLVQKTGPLQHSPFIRGFTGYQNLLMIDGVRLNHSAMRAGPNQYWSTVDSLAIRRLELTRGPHSVLYGSDAIGGTVNVLPWRRECFDCGLHIGGGMYTRYASGENATFTRAELEGNVGSFGWAGGMSYKRYGDIVSGSGRLPETGDIDEWDGDLRFDWRLNRSWTLTVAGQRVRQIDAPRTERTIFAVPFAGTSVGSELKRDFDQERTLVYARIAFDGGPCCRPFSRGRLTVSRHRHAEQRDRLRTGDRRDLSGFVLDQYGVSLELESPTPWGRLTYGADYYRDEVESSRDNYVGGVLTRHDVQGPVGDEASYDLLGVFVQDEIRFGRLNVFAGLRFTYAAADADRVDNPAVAGTDPSTPGNIIGVDDSWTNLVGSVRGVYSIDSRWRAFGGVSQAFRAPSLHDLTSLDSTSVVESPSPGLEPEKYLSFELGLKTEQRALTGSASVWYTRMSDTIIRSPTGALIMGVPEVRKDNIGDGYAWGAEIDLAWQCHPCWLMFLNASYMDAEVDELDTASVAQKKPLSRMKPFTTMLGARYQPPKSRFWVQAEWLHAEKEDRLSFRDAADSRRIPPGGTPGWDVINLRGGLTINPRMRVSLGLENLFDENYRIHGSGVNEPGFQAVVSLDLDF